MRSILTALNGLRSSLDNPELDRVIEKIASLIPGDQAEAFSRSMEMLVVEMTPWGLPGKRRDSVRLVHQAILEARLLEFSYYSRRGEETRRVVEPMTLLYKGQTWYVFGWCTLRGEYRVFRLSRMREPALLLRGFRRREESYRNHMGGETLPEGTELVSLHLRFRPEARIRVEDFFDDENIIQTEDGVLEVRAVFPDGDWVTSMILAYGAAVEVLEPAAVRERIHREAAATAALYR
jgi:predicted DNA-binding transcriptional regulator YafY